MKIRTRLLLISFLAVAGAVALVTGAVSISARRAFDRTDQTRRDALLDQFRQELDTQGKDVLGKVERVAASEPVTRIAIEATRNEPDYSVWLNEAQMQAETLSLDFLDLLTPNGAIVSSAHWPARFGYRNDWVSVPADALETGAFLTPVPTPEGSEIGLVAVRQISLGDAHAYVAGGKRLDQAFLSSLHLAPGGRVLLETAALEHPELGALVKQVLTSGRPATAVVQWTSDRASAESFYALPLARGNTVLGVLLVGKFAA